MGKILVTGSSGFIGKKIVKRLDKLKVITDSNNSRGVVNQHAAKTAGLIFRGLGRGKI